MPIDLDKTLTSMDGVLGRVQRVIDSHDTVSRGTDTALQAMESGAPLDPVAVRALRHDLADARLEAAAVHGELSTVREAIAEQRAQLAEGGR